MRKYRVLMADLPGPCTDCAAWLRKCRWIASTVTALLLVIGAVLSSSGNVIFLIVTGLYGFYVVRTGSYGFFDAVLYGGELEEKTIDIRPRFPEGGPIRIRFPDRFLRGVFRLALTACLAGLLAFVGGEVIKRRRGAEREIPREDMLELLSREKVVFFPLSPGGSQWVVQDQGSMHTAVAYTQLSSVPGPSVEQMSPHDAFERALNDSKIEAIIIDPGRNQLLVTREDFGYYKMRVPPWATPRKVVSKE